MIAILESESKTDVWVFVKIRLIPRGSMETIALLQLRVNPWGPAK